MPTISRLTPPQVAERYGVAVEKIHHWIRTGELQALNVATSPHGRPRWSIDPADLQVFEARRQARPQPPATRRRRQSGEHVTEYF
jgi:hypothetical protein